jgi:hypothetical protein
MKRRFNKILTPAGFWVDGRVDIAFFSTSINMVQNHGPRRYNRKKWTPTKGTPP